MSPSSGSYESDGVAERRTQRELNEKVGERLVQRMGQTGIRVLTRIMGLLLAAIAVQFVISGTREAFRATSP